MRQPGASQQEDGMTRFLNLASKALAVVGVLTLMWTAGGMQQANAQATTIDGDYLWPCYYGKEDGRCHGWICLAGHCANLPATNDSGEYYCCY